MPAVLPCAPGTHRGVPPCRPPVRTPGCPRTARPVPPCCTAVPQCGRTPGSSHTCPPPPPPRTCTHRPVPHSSHETPATHRYSGGQLSRSQGPHASSAARAGGASWARVAASAARRNSCIILPSSVLQAALHYWTAPTLRCPARLRCTAGTGLFPPRPSSPAMFILAAVQTSADPEVRLTDTVPDLWE